MNDRDEIAARAMVALLSNPYVIHRTHETLAREAFDAIDAWIAERDKRNTQEKDNAPPTHQDS